MVLVRNGKLRDVFVRIAQGTPFPAESLPPPARVEIPIDRVDCVFVPRVQGVFVDSRPGGEATLRLGNADPFAHSTHLHDGPEHLSSPMVNKRGTPPTLMEMGGLRLVVFTCDYHRWERSFLFATSHPYFAVTADDGTFTIDSVPPGTYEIEAWHSFYGWKRQAGVTVTPGGAATVDFGYSTATDRVPEENRDEDWSDLAFPPRGTE